MSDILKELQEATESIRDHYKGTKVLQTHTIPATKVIEMSAQRIRSIRARIPMSQKVFAQRLHVSCDTLEKWEQGRSKPRGTAVVLLALVDKQPGLIEN